MLSLLDEFRDLLVDKGHEEESLQDFLKSHPEILAHTFNQGAHYSTVFSKFHLGDEHIPDFMMVGHRSAGSWDVDLIEIEPALLDRPLFNRSKEATGRLRIAIGQVEKWQIWMGKHEDYFKERALYEIKANHAWDKSIFFNEASQDVGGLMLTSYRIIIGRRENFEGFGYEYRNLRWKESGHTLEIVPWDRLLDKAARFVT